MNLQKIKSINGADEYVLLPINAYKLLKHQIDQIIDEDYVKFELKEYVQNPVALARIYAGLTQENLAKYLQVSQAYISKIEKQIKVTPKIIQQVKKVIKEQRSKEA